jgi:hypothetical protein
VHCHLKGVRHYDNNKSYFEALGVPEGQIFNVSFGEDTESFIKDKIKTKENKGKLKLK